MRLPFGEPCGYARRQGEILMQATRESADMARSSYSFKGCLKAWTILLLLGGVFLLAACAMVSVSVRSLPPILTQEELVRPYSKVGVVEVSRERFGSIEDLSPADYEWAYQALREEAQKIGADALILPEVKVDLASYLLFPSSEITARGTAIKFR